MSTATISMTEELTDYLWSVSGREHPLLARLRAETQANNPHAMMQISPIQGQFMQTLIAATGARQILEVGVFTGYSSLAMALAMPPDGQLVALDVSDKFTQVARRYWQEAGLERRIELRLAPAIDSLDALLASGDAGRFDLMFIDADKENYIEYWQRGLQLLRRGGVILVDNTLFSGRVLPRYDDAALAELYKDRTPQSRDSMIALVKAIRAFNEAIYDDQRVKLSMLPVGDGLTMAVKC